MAIWLLGLVPAVDCESDGLVERDELKYLRTQRSHDVPYLVRRWNAVARKAKLQMTVLSQEEGYPVIALSGDGTREQPGVYLSAGIHGDEPAAVLGLLEWCEARVQFLQSVPVVLLPILNPWGLVNNVRLDHRGRDLNRAFDGRKGPIGALRTFLRNRRFAVAASLHEDYDAHGIYVYEIGPRGYSIADDLLKATEAEIPRHEGSVEGRRTQQGVLRRSQGLRKIAREIEGMPESIYLHLHHAEIALTFETPSEFSLWRRVRAQRAFLEGIRGAMEKG